MLVSERSSSCPSKFFCGKGCSCCASSNKIEKDLRGKSTELQSIKITCLSYFSPYLFEDELEMSKKDKGNIYLFLSKKYYIANPNQF